MRPEPHLPRRPHFSIVDRPFCKRTVDSARERLASLGCVSLECGLRGFVRLRRMLLSLALGWVPPLREKYARRFPNRLREIVFNAQVKWLLEMAYESQMACPSNDTSSIFRQALAFNRAQQGPTLRRSWALVVVCRVADATERESSSQWNETSRGGAGKATCRSWRIAVCPSDAAGDNSDTFLI
jgi:hypothetical protein